jgi:hypothetical protein
MLARRGDANGPERAGAARGDYPPRWFASEEDAMEGPAFCQERAPISEYDGPMHTTGWD